MGWEEWGMIAAVKQMREALEEQVARWQGLYRQWRNHAHALEKRNGELQQEIEKLKAENSKLKTAYRDLHSRAVGRIKAVRETNQKLAKAHDSLHLKFDRSYQIATRLQGQVRQLEQQVQELDAENAVLASRDTHQRRFLALLSAFMDEQGNPAIRESLKDLRHKEPEEFWAMLVSQFRKDLISQEAPREVWLEEALGPHPEDILAPAAGQEGSAGERATQDALNEQTAEGWSGKAAEATEAAEELEAGEQPPAPRVAV